jgi:SAM-dependent methyltransferase
MERIPEPELMDDEAQARAYAEADFEEPHSRFVAQLRERLPDLPVAGTALDLGCGPGDVTLRVAHAFPVFSNSLLHHLRDPLVLWQCVGRWLAPGGAVFVMDLMRPENPATAQQLVGTYAAAEPDILRRDFFSSLLAAYRVEEVRQQLRLAGLAHLRVASASDRHFVVWGRRVTGKG